MYENVIEDSIFLLLPLFISTVCIADFYCLHSLLLMLTLLIAHPPQKKIRKQNKNEQQKSLRLFKKS